MITQYMDAYMQVQCLNKLIHRLLAHEILLT